MAVGLAVIMSGEAIMPAEVKTIDQTLAARGAYELTGATRP